MSKYGLDPAGYDRDLVEDIRAVLGLPGGDVRKALEKNEVTVEALLHAALVSLGPFAGMLSDLLRLYEMAAADRADHPNLLIEYDFGAGRPPLPFHLEEFRGWAEVSAKVARIVRVQVWSDERLWRLTRVLRDADPQIDRDSRTWTQAVADWVRVYDEGDWPANVPALAPTGRADRDRLLRRVRTVAVDVLRRCRELSANRGDLQRRTDDARSRDLAEGDLADVVALAHVDSDHWLSEIVITLNGVVDRMRTDRGFDTVGLERELSAVLDSVPVTSASVERTEAALVEVLTLPAWDRRHELYAAWVLTQIVDAVGTKRCALHPTADGRLSFSFRGSHVATIATPARGPVAVWAELRSPSANPIGRGRKRAIQPDYTLLTAPVTAPASALAVVECKQYRRASAANFAAALQDYAAARPAAHVLLVNYGPARESVLDRVAEPERPRCAIGARLRPDEPGPRARFATWLRDALDLDQPQDASTREQERSGADSSWATIRLDWSHQPRDLDLHVVVGSDPTTTINHNNRGAIHKPPFARLDRDVTTGHGPETVTVTRPALLKIFVQRFSDDGTLAASGAQVSLRTPRADVVLRYLPSRDVDGRTWRVAKVLPDGTVTA